jgi:hypothetical protein
MTTNPSTRKRILETADKAVNGERNASYGDPTQDFARTARYWNEHLCAIYERKIARRIALHPESREDLESFLDYLVDMISSEDVATMMMLLKISRISWSPNKEDHWVDVAGYAACGAQCAETHGGLN